MKVKVGDNVRILAGKDKGKEGRVIRTLKKDNKVVVEGINMVKKHVKPNRMNEVGSIVDIEAPIHVSNVKLAETKKEAKKEAKKATAKPVEEKTTKKTTKKSEKKAS
ncbi:MAG: 50S ribosomal protein L24 [Bacilli bacterium]|nr:50S ribosomal protein L24 [Bacilli bacterium]